MAADPHPKQSSGNSNVRSIRKWPAKCHIRSIRIKLLKYTISAFRGPMLRRRARHAVDQRLPRSAIARAAILSLRAERTGVQFVRARNELVAILPLPGERAG